MLPMLSVRKKRWDLEQVNFDFFFSIERLPPPLVLTSMILQIRFEAVSIALQVFLKLFSNMYYLNTHQGSFGPSLNPRIR